MSVPKGLLISKEVGVAFHRQVEALGQNIIPCTGRVFRALHIQLISLIAHSLPEVRVRLQPHFRLAYFVDRVQLVIEDGDMRVDILALQDLHQLHFDGVAAAVSDSTLRACRHDEIIFVLGCALLDGADGVFPDVAGEPFVHGRHTVAPAL